MQNDRKKWFLPGHIRFFVIPCCQKEFVFTYHKINTLQIITSSFTITQILLFP